MEKKDFRDALFQYMEEISDPSHRAEQEVCQNGLKLHHNQQHH